MIKSKFFSKIAVSLWFCVLVLISMTGCMVVQESQSEDTSKLLTSTIMATTIQPALEIEATPSEALSLLPTATPAIIQTIAPTLIPVATLSVEQEALLEASAELAQELMETNGGCQLPCWWGVSLGDSAENAIERFNGVFDEKFDNDSMYYAFRFKIVDEHGIIRLGYHNPEMSIMDVSISIDYHFIDGEVQFIDVSVERPLPQYGEETLIRDWEKYSISSMLQRYGKPQYVYLFPQSIADPGPLNFTLVLYYPELGLTFEYMPHDVSRSETQADLCLGLENMRSISFTFYNPEFVHLHPRYLLPPALNPEAEEFFKAMTWEGVSGMDLDTFYEIYRSENPECIQITR